MKQIKIGIVGSRRRNSDEDYNILIHTFNRIIGKLLGVYFGELEVTIVTGDCDKGGDKFAKEIAETFDCILDVKYKKDLKTGKRWISARFSGWVHGWDFTKMCYARNEEIAKEPLDYLLALVAPDRTGGTENTIKHFKRLHKDWEEKLIIL